MFNKKLLAFLVVGVLLVSAVAAGPALAAKGGGGRHGGGGTPPPTGTATCSVTPNPVSQWALTTISGSGFAPNSSVGYFISGSGGTAMGFAVTDATGSFSTVGQAVWLGTNTVTVASSATCTFNVV